MRRHRMTGWYEPGMLLDTAFRVVVSTLFGEFADRRETAAGQRALDIDRIDPALDYAGRDEIWLDFLADTGDGWDPTYAMARLLAEPVCLPASDGVADPLPVGHALILGGDQVYPTASREAYRERLQAPLDLAWTHGAAARGASGQSTTPDVFAIPGNHDWYDGLRSFMAIFCTRQPLSPWVDQARARGRLVGGRRARQVRSYFALRLPHNWWLWGVDVQLEGYIDQPQIDFFATVARRWMPDGANVILCTGRPDWLLADPAAPEDGFRNHAFLENVVCRERGHQLRLVVTGDNHHYARYVERHPGVDFTGAPLPDGVTRHYITAGGGGAFLHPTHLLPPERVIAWDAPPPNARVPEAARAARDTREHEGVGARSLRRDDEWPADSEPGRHRRVFTRAADPRTGAPAVFPDARTSFRLSFANLAFAAINWKLTGAIAGIWLTVNWLASWTQPAGGSSTAFHDALTGVGGSPWHVLTQWVLFAGASPGVMLIALAVWGGLYGFAPCSGARRVALGTLHTLAQLLAGIGTTVGLAHLGAFTAAQPVLALQHVGVALACGAAGATVFGLYLLVCLDVLGLHENEAFSALRIAGHKCALKLHIDRAGALTVYPLAVPAFPSTRRLDDESPPPPPTAARLVEAPIVLPLAPGRLAPAADRGGGALD